MILTDKAKEDLKEEVYSNSKIVAWKDKQKKKLLIPKKLNSACYKFLVYGFEKFDIFVFDKKPTVKNLKDIKLSDKLIKDYTSHKNYNYSGGRCKRFKDENIIIICIGEYENIIERDITAVHELSHCSHRILDSIKDNLENYEESHCALLDYLTEQYLYITSNVKFELFKNRDLVWFHVITNN